MSDELPPLWALDKAAKATETHCGPYLDWNDVPATAGATRSSIIAHARTIAQWEQPPVDEDEEALCRILNQWVYGDQWVVDQYRRICGPKFSAALAQFKRELEARK